MWFSCLSGLECNYWLHGLFGVNPKYLKEFNLIKRVYFCLNNLHGTVRELCETYNKKVV